MKTRILFVDDDPLVLQGLQRMLRSMRQEWEMEFVDGAASALARLAESSFDVVVWPWPLNSQRARGGGLSWDRNDQGPRALSPCLLAVRGRGRLRVLLR